MRNDTTTQAPRKTFRTLVAGTLAATALLAGGATVVVTDAPAEADAVAAEGAEVAGCWFRWN